MTKHTTRGLPRRRAASVVDAGGPGVDGVVSAAVGLGIRAAIGPSLADIWHDEHGVLTHQADPDRLLTDAQAAIERHDGAGNGRILAQRRLNAHREHPSIS